MEGKSGESSTRRMIKRRENENEILTSLKLCCRRSLMNLLLLNNNQSEANFFTAGKFQGGVEIFSARQHWKMKISSCFWSKIT